MHARGELARPAGGRGGPPALFEARARAGRGPGSTTRCSPSGTRYLVAALAEAGARHRRAGVARRRGRETAEFLLANLRRADGRWLRAWQADAGARHLAYAADHGALVDAFTRLAEATGEARWIAEARAAADALLDLFWDDEHGGVFTTGHDAEALIARPKDLMDNATPGANGLAAVGLLRLAALTGDDALPRARRGDRRACSARWPCEHPTAFGHVLAAVDLVARGTTEIVVAGDRPDLVDVVRAAVPAQRGAGLGRALRQPAVGGPGRRPGLRLPGLRLPAAGRRRRDAGRSARQQRHGSDSDDDLAGVLAGEHGVERLRGATRAPRRRGCGR